MASSLEQQATAEPIPGPEVVGYAFVRQYYHILHESPHLVHRFYQDNSKLGRPEDDGIMDSVSTLDAINKKIISLGHGGFNAEIKTVDAQNSLDGAVLVLVTGYLTGKDNVKRTFTQTFFLAPQEVGYFVLNDMFRCVDDADNDKNQVSAGKVDAPLTPDQAEPAVVKETHLSEQMTASSEEVNGEEVYNPSENVEALDAEEEPPVPEVVDEFHDESQLATESIPKIDDVQKSSYASIVMRDGGPSLSTTSSTPPRSLPKEQLVAAQPPATLPADRSVISSNAVENGNSKEGEADGYSIYVNSLPMNATPALLEAEFKRFGAIKNNGIQVRSNNGFCFGFVEFEVASAVQTAIKESPIMLDGCQVRVEAKRSNSRVNNRGRLPNGRGAGGFRSDGARGRVNYGGGRGFNRAGDFNNRNEFGYRNGGRGGGYSNRGGDGFQRADHVGSNGGGRVNHGMAVNATGNKNMAQRVSTTAQLSNSTENGH